MPSSFRNRDLFLHRKILTVDGAAGSGRVACAVRSVDRAADRYTTQIWEFTLDGGGGRQLTRGSADTSPRWSPDGSQLAFTSSRDGGSPQLHLLARDGGEARPVGHFEQGVQDLRWTPDGRGLVLTVAVAVDPEARGKESSGAKPKDDEDAPQAKVELAWRLPYKEDGIGYLLKRQIHLFHVDADSGQARQLTRGAFDVQAFDISADGRQVAYSRTRDGRCAHDCDLWSLELTGGEPRQLTSGHAMVMQPAWSPDARQIAFTGAVEEGDAESRLWLVDLASRRVRDLGGDDVDVADPMTLHWTPDGRAIVFTRGWRGRHQVVRIDVDSGEVSVLVDGDRQLGGFDVVGDRLVYSIEHPSLPSDLWASDAQGRNEKRLSDLNPWWNDREPIVAEVRKFQVPDGKGGEETIEGWLIRRKGQRGPTPLLDDMHGGPASYALLDFDTNVFWQTLCAAGWSVLALNAVGSATYGREFCCRLAGNWGRLDLPQHEAAIRQLQREGVCDERVAVSGKSYGGYLSAWATGHTDLFKAAVVMAPVGNIETHYGTSDGGYYADPFYVASQPRFDREKARELSPLQYIEKSGTPTLFMQGKDDERCPKCQSEEMFVSLYRAGDTPAELVLYPGEHHSFLGSGAPSCRHDAANRIVDWFERFIPDERGRG